MDEYDDIISAAIPKKPRRTYDRNQPDEADWSLDRVNELQDFYSSTFKRQLPLSNKGQSSYHNKLGFDHRDSSDISLNPTSAEGQQLMKFMRERNMPFLAFDRAIPGISSGPHIHAGRPSGRTGNKYAPGAQVKSKRMVGDNYDDIIQAAVPQTPATVQEVDSYDDVIAAATTSVPVSTGRFGAPRAPIKQQRGPRDAFAGLQAGAGGQQQQPPLTGTEDLLNTIGGREKRGEDIQNILEGVTGAVAGTGRQLANAQELGMRVTPIGIAGRELSKRVTGFDPQAIPSKIKDASQYLESAVAENEAARPAPDTFLGNVRRGVGKGVGAAVVEMPKLILGGRALGAANLPTQGALARADEGVSGIIKGVAGGLVYHYGGALTGKAFSGVSPYLAKVGNSLVWIAGPVAEQQLIAKVTDSEAPNLAQSIGENIPFGIMAGMGAKGKRPQPVQVKEGNTVRDAIETDLPKIVSRELEVVPPAVEAAERRTIQREFDKIKETESPQRFQHIQFGEVEVIADQSGTRPGKVRVAEVADPTKQHFVKKSDLQGRGNARMIPIKESVEVLPEAPAEKPQQPPETEGALPATPPSPTVRESERPVMVTIQGREQRATRIPTPEEDIAYIRSLGEDPKDVVYVRLEDGNVVKVRPHAIEELPAPPSPPETLRVEPTAADSNPVIVSDGAGGFQVKGRTGVLTKSFKTKEEAARWLSEVNEAPKSETTSAEQGVEPKTIKGDEAKTPRDVPVESRKVDRPAIAGEERTIYETTKTQAQRPSVQTEQPASRSQSANAISPSVIERGERRPDVLQVDTLVKEPWEMTQLQVSSRKAESVFPLAGKIEVRNDKPVFIYSTKVKWGGGERTFEIEDKRGQPNGAEQARRLHRKVVEQALAEGKPVPAEVLVDYPELRPKVSEQPPKEVIPSEATAQKVSESTPSKVDVFDEGAGLGGTPKGEPPAPSKPELPKVKEAFRLPFIDPAERGNQARLKQSINLEYATESGRQIKKAVTIGKRQKQLENKHSVIGKLLDCLHA